MDILKVNAAVGVSVSSGSSTGASVEVIGASVCVSSTGGSVGTNLIVGESVGLDVISNVGTGVRSGSGGAAAHNSGEAGPRPT